MKNTLKNNLYYISKHPIKQKKKKKKHEGKGMRLSAQQKRQKKKTARDNILQGWNDVAVWRDFKPIYIPTDIWPQYLEHNV
jgi:hypothetical protein